MEFQKVLEKRQSVRKFTNDEVKNEDIMQMVKAASIAPSGKNLQNWHYVIVKNPKIKKKMEIAAIAKNNEIAEKAAVKNPEMAEKFQKLFRNFALFSLRAPAIVLVFSHFYKPTGYDEIRSYDSDSKEAEMLMMTSSGLQGVGAGIEHFYLKAVELGYGICWQTSLNYMDCEFRQILKEEGIFSDDKFFLAATLALGVPDGPAKSPEKKTAEKICTIAE